MNDPSGAPGSWPAPEQRRPWAAPGALTVGVVYLVWRLAATRSGVPPALFWPLFAAELYGWVRLAGRTFVTWSLPTGRRPAAAVVRSVDVAVFAFAEPVEDVRAALIGCVRVAYPHRTVLVDDAHRPELADLAAEYGAAYVARNDTTGGRTGAINHVLATSDAELVAVLDADQIPLPDMLHQTAGYFDDPTVAVVQTPVEFLNRDSVLHSDRSRHERSNVQEVVAPARDHLDAATWDGSAAVLRRDALNVIGGVPTSGSTGELQATIRLQGTGRRVRYHPEPVVQGSAPHNLDAFLTQRARWARGHLSVVATRDNPLWARGLSTSQRVAHVDGLVEYLAAPFQLAAVAVVVGTLLDGRLPFSVDVSTMVVAWAVWAAASSTAWVALSRGRVRRGETSVRAAITLQIHAGALLAVLLRRDRRFTPVRRDGVDLGGVDVLRRLPLLGVLTLVLEAAVALRLLDSLIGWPLPRKISGPELVLMATAGSVLLWFLLRVLGVFVRRRQQRSRYRVEIDIAALAVGRPAKVTDLSEDGIGVVTTELHRVGETIPIVVRLALVDGTVRDLQLTGLVRTSLPNQHTTRWRVGCQFLEPSREDRDAIIEYTRIVRSYRELRRPRTAATAA